MPEFEQPVIYARFEPTTDATTIRLHVDHSDEGPLTERDLAFYHDKDTTQSAGIIPWSHSRSFPKEGDRTTTLNCATYRLQWLPPLESRVRQSAAVKEYRKACQTRDCEEDNLRTLQQTISALNQNRGVTHYQPGEILVETVPNATLDRWCRITLRRRYRYADGRAEDRIETLYAGSASGCLAYLQSLSTADAAATA